MPSSSLAHASTPVVSQPQSLAPIAPVPNKVIQYVAVVAAPGSGMRLAVSRAMGAGTTGPKRLTLVHHFQPVSPGDGLPGGL